MADYDWFSEHQEAAARQHVEDYRNRARGFVPVYLNHEDRPTYYQCRRGCGTLVWDVDVHISSVCTEFNPVVGDA